jgi:hypothetical protein
LSLATALIIFISLTLVSHSFKKEKTGCLRSHVAPAINAATLDITLRCAHLQRDFVTIANNLDTNPTAAHILAQLRLSNAIIARAWVTSRLTAQPCASAVQQADDATLVASPDILHVIAPNKLALVAPVLRLAAVETSVVGSEVVVADTEVSLAQQLATNAAGQTTTLAIARHKL